MNEFQEEHQTGLMLLRIAVVFSFFTGAYSVLVSFTNLAIYGYFFLYGSGINPVENPEWISWWKQIQDQTYPFLLINLYNIVLWNAVIIFTIWLFRFYEWARRYLGWILGFDMIFTVGHLFWLVFRDELHIPNSGSFIMMNVVQVGVIVILAHPKVMQLTQMHTALLQTLKQDDTDSRED